jgi:hypothetical protein
MRWMSRGLEGQGFEVLLKRPLTRAQVRQLRKRYGVVCYGDR